MKPRYKVDLSRQQANHEANYQRLLGLTPDLDDRECWQYIIGNGHTSDSYIAISIKERTKYTTTVHLLQCCRSQNIYDNNAIKVRLYHDAHLAEVLSWQNLHQNYSHFQARYNYPNRYMHQCDEKAGLNSFLGELLTHCLLHGRVAKNILSATISE
jgi:uncharacterized protein